VLVDDGLATGHSACAAARALYRSGAAEVILAVPVGAPGSIVQLQRSVDRVFALRAPAQMLAIGLWYRDFRPPSDEQLAAILCDR
jgi:putative phosphoribosyl transferase